MTRTLEAPAVTPLAPPAARTLAGVFAATVAAWPDRVALDAAGATLTYRELDARARAFAARLAELGAGPGDRVGVRVASGTHELYVAILGTLLAGAAYVPVDADDPAARASAIWAQAGVCAVAGDGLALTPLAPPAGQAGRPPAPEDDAWIIFTSGSTGAPKGVAVTHRSAAAFVDAETRLWTVREDDRVLAGLSVGFDASCEEMWLAWRNGAALVPAPRALVRSGAELGPWLRAQDVSVVSTVPTLAALWDDDALAGVRLLILGGEALSAELAARLAAEGREVWNTYGPTEATVVTTATRVRAGAPVTIGAPLDGWQVAVVDPGTGAPVTPGEPGELVVAGVGLARYLDARLDAERYAALPALGWERAYRTGDIVRESPDGLVFVGRADDQVKIGGRRLELGEVEAQLAGAPGVRAAAVALQTTPGGNKVLAGYVVGHGAGAVDLDAIRAHLAQRLPAGVAPVLVALDELPVRASGKVDRAALPWPPPAAPGGDDASAGDADGTLGWLAGQWADQLGPLPMDAASDFFALGGTSLAVAKLVSRLRERFPAVAVADVYRHRRLGELAAHLDALGDAAEDAGEAGAAPRGRFALGQLGGLLGLFALGAVPWLAGILAYDDWRGAGAGPHLAWAWLAVIWLVVLSAPGRAGLVLLARRLLLGDITPGRHPRHGALALRLWLVERLADVCHLDQLAGTPWAVRYARALGHRVARDARLGTLPPVTARVTVGAGATIEPDVDLHGWWIEGGDLVIGEVRIGAGARVGTRALLMPGAEVGAGAEVEPGSVVTGIVPGGERWAGSPARYAGRAGESWPNGAPAPARRARAWRAMYGVGLAIKTLLPLLASAPGIALVLVAGGATSSPWGTAAILAATAPLVAASFVVAYALLVAAGVRAVAPLVRCGWHPDDGAVGWALWFAEGLMGGARETLFPLFSSVYTRAWLRLCGVEVGRRTEISTAVGLNRHVRFGETSFAADDVLFAGGRARWGWLHVAPVTVGDRTFLGNGALVRGGSRLGDDGLVGVLTVAPETAPDGTSWLGAPAIELPRVADRVDPARTTDPPRRLVVARGAVELVRILLPGTLSVAIASLVFGVLDTVGRADGGLVMALVATPVLLGGALLAAAATVAVKWLLMGRYARGEHPLWSWFVWRDEIVNSCQEQLAGTWLLEPAFGTPLLPAYLRAMGATVGRDVWCETLALTEFDLVTLGDGAVLNRNACVETHLFHDRLMRIGPALLGAGATLGPKSAVLPDTVVGDGASVGGRSVVLRGEELPPRTRWAGAPVERA